MAISKKSSFAFIPEILDEAIQGEFVGMTALYGKDAVIINGTLGSQKKGEKVQVPYFGNIGDMEDLADNEGGPNPAPVPALTPAALTSSMEEAVVHHSGKAVEITEWAQMSISFADPYAEMARQIVQTIGRRADRALIELAAASTLSYDGTADTIKTITWDKVVKAKGLFGDEIDLQNGISLGMMHSKVATDAELLVDGQGRPLLVNPVDGSLSRIGNIPFGRSDKLEILPATTPKTFNTLLAKPKSMVFWYNGGVQVQTDKDILTDARIAAVHIYWAAHMYTRMPGGTKPGVVRVKTQ